ncbi:hypothetical protein [Emticicia sp. 17c]|uniref:hypothetical protein n=1 Tax=Emticicia sp. 17c TaxID=3127704 RepID=UPI00301E2AF1
MKIEFKKLFTINLSSNFYADNNSFDDVVIEPTSACADLFRKYRLEFRNTPQGAFLFYEGREKTPPTVSPVIEIKNEVTFIFRLKIKNPVFYDYANASDWQGGKIYFFKNTSYNTTGNIAINADLTSPLLNRPEKFKFEIERKDTDSLVTITDAAGGFIENIVVLKKQNPADSGKDFIDIDLSKRPDGEYKISHIGTTNELKCYKASQFEPQTFAYLHITYKHGAWTTDLNLQVFELNFKTKALVWKYEIHQWAGKKAASVIAANTVEIKDKAAAPVIFAPEGILDFPLTIKSNAAIELKNNPKRIQLVSGTKVLIDSLPNPTTNNFQKTVGGIIALMKITI